MKAMVMRMKVKTAVMVIRLGETLDEMEMQIDMKKGMKMEMMSFCTPMKQRLSF
jgi:hypothetical protein